MQPKHTPAGRSGQPPAERSGRPPAEPRPSAPAGPPQTVLCSPRQPQLAAAIKEPPQRPLCTFEQVRGEGDAELLRLSDVQHGCVHRAQLIAAGFSKAAIHTRLANGRLHRLHPQVYLVGRRGLEPLSLEMAAVLHYKGYAVLGGRSAAALWGMIEAQGRPGEGQARPVEVTVVGRSTLPPAGVHRRRAVALDAREVRWRSGVPLTAPARTLLELGAVLAVDELEGALARAVRLGLIREQELRAWLGHWARGTSGLAPLRALLATRTRAADTRSLYERKLLRLVRTAGLPEPIMNTQVAGHLVDMHWPGQRLVVEFDGWEFHRERAEFERDRRRDQDLIAAGQRVVRVTARHVDREPDRITTTLLAALGLGLVADAAAASA